MLVGNGPRSGNGHTANLVILREKLRFLSLEFRRLLTAFWSMLHKNVPFKAAMYAEWHMESYI